MRSETSAFDLFFITKELQKLKNAKLEKVFHSKEKKNEVLFRFYTKEYGKVFLKIATPSHIYLTQYKEDSEVPSGFGMFLRRHLQGTRLVNISQKGFDRVLDLEFEIRKKGVTSTNHLIVELFNPGNVVLINGDSKILGLLNSQRWKDRTISPGKPYVFPEPQFDPIHSTKEDFVKKIKSSSKDSLVVALASDVSLGGENAEELCVRVKLDKDNKISDLSETDLGKLFDEIQRLKEQSIKGVVYEKTIVAFEFLSAGDIKKEYATFCEALDEQLTKKKNASNAKDSELKQKTKISKIENILKKQEQMLSNAIENSEKYQKIGEKIYAHYEGLTALFVEIKTLRDTMDWIEIKKLFKERYPRVQINEKNNEIVVDIE